MNTTTTATATQAPRTKKPKPLGPSIRFAEAAVLLGVSIATCWRWHKENLDDFPRARKIGPRTTILNTAEVIAWRDRRAQAGAKP